MTIKVPACRAVQGPYQLARIKIDDVGNGSGAPAKVDRCVPVRQQRNVVRALGDRNPKPQFTINVDSSEVMLPIVVVAGGEQHLFIAAPPGMRADRRSPCGNQQRTPCELNRHLCR